MPVTDYYISIAKKIPASIRDSRILTPERPVEMAVASPGDPYIKRLAKIWFTFIEPNTVPDMKCGNCLRNLLDNFREILPALEKLKAESELLNSL